MHGLIQDIAFAVRTLRRHWPFAAFAATILGLGIGASTTLFSVVNGVLLRPLPFEEPERLVVMGSRDSGRRAVGLVSVPELMDMQRELRTVEGLAAAKGSALDLVGDRDPERVAVSEVSPDFFRVLRVAPVIGRPFTSDEHRASGARVAVISHALWQRRWGGDPAILGRTFLGGTDDRIERYTVVGVMPPGFRNPRPLEHWWLRLPPAEVWTPLTLDAAAYAGSRDYWNVKVVGRLTPAATQGALRSELDRLAASLLQSYPEVHRRGDRIIGLGSRPLLDAVVGNRRLDILVLLGATGLLLLIACGNVSGLLLARANDRARELWLRSALGAARARLARQMLTESGILALAGGLLGTGLAFLGTAAFRHLGPTNFPRLADVTVDLRVLAFGLLASVGAGLLFGAAPALLSSAGACAETARFGGPRVVGGRTTTRLRAALVGGEVALALTLLTGGALLGRSILRLQGERLGFDPENLVLMQVSLPATYVRDDQRSEFFRELRVLLAALPGVRSVSHVEDPPMGFYVWGPPVRTEGAHVTDQDEGPSAIAHPVGSDYFRTMGIRLLAGRALTEADGQGSLPVVVVNDVMAARLWPGESAIGKRMSVGGGPAAPWLTVVGVVNGVRQDDLTSSLEMECYLPYAQRPRAKRVYMVVKTALDPAALVGPMRLAVRALDANVPIPEFTTMHARVAATLRLARFRTLLLGGFALIALALASAGVYATVRYAVARRTREVGIRLALGAAPSEVVALMVRQGLRPVLAGVGIGVLGAIAATRVLASVLFEITPLDLPSFVGTAALLLAIGLLSAWLPARHAAHVAPGEALRTE